MSCTNGLGHVRRLIGILEQLAERSPDIDVELVCEAWQIERLRGWTPLERLLQSGLETHFGWISPGVEWRLTTDDYSDQNLLSWEERLVDCAPIHEADLVLSDNLGAITDLRPDAVLVGSFLWSDTLAAAHAGHPAIDRFVERERALLERHRPPMLCVEALATPGVLQRTQPVTLPWMCELEALDEPRPERRLERVRIGVATGASAISGRRVHELSAELAARGARRGWTIAVPAPEGRPATWEREAELGGLPNLEPFRYQASDYARADLILCRPGTGALTQCVTHGLPMLCLREPGSPEMAHNASRIEALNLGIDLGEDPSVEKVIQAIESVLEPENYERYRQFNDQQPKGGLAKAAAWIAERVATTSNRQQSDADA